jgi:hypothetical protein
VNPPLDCSASGVWSDAAESKAGIAFTTPRR